MREQRDSTVEERREQLREAVRDTRRKRTAGDFWQAVDALVDFERYDAKTEAWRAVARANEAQVEAP